MTIGSPRLLASASLVLLLAGGASAAAHAGQASGNEEDLVIAQAYVSDLHPVDPHAAGDTAALHVSATLGQQTSHTLIALTLAPAGMPTLRLTQTQDPQDNQRPELVALLACPLTESYPSQVDPADPPAYDCAKASVTGIAGAGGVWTFDLTSLRQAWAPQSGVAVVAGEPQDAEPGQTWQLAFDPNQTAVVRPALPVPFADAAVRSEDGSTASGSTPGGATSPAGPTFEPDAISALPDPAGDGAAIATTPLPPAVAEPPAPSAGQPVTVDAVATEVRERVPTWAWIVMVVLGALCAALAAALGSARRKEAQSSPYADGRVPMTSAWRALRESPALTAASVVVLLVAFIAAGNAGPVSTFVDQYTAGTPDGSGTEPATDGNVGGSAPDPVDGSGPAGSAAATSDIPSTPPGTPRAAGSIRNPGSPGTSGTSGSMNCTYSCSIPYQGDGRTPFGPAPKPAGGNGGRTAVGVTDDTLRIGVIGSRNTSDFNGADAMQGLKAFVNKINAVEGGIYGRKIAFDYYGTNNDTPEGGVAAARQVISRNVGAVIINGVDGADAAGQVLGQAGVPFLSSQSSYESLKTQPTVFTVTSPVEDHARGLVNFMVDRLGQRSKICFFVTNTNLWRSAVIPTLREQAKKRGVEVPVIAETQYTQTSFVAQLKQMQDSGCTGVGMFTILESVGIVRDAKSINYNPVFSGDEWTFDVLVQGEYGAAGSFYGMKVLRLIGTADEPGFDDYFRDSKTYTPDDIALPDAAVHYAIAQLAVEGLKRAGPRLTRDTFVEGLLSFRKFSTKGILDETTYTREDRAGTHTVYTAECCSTAQDGTTRWKKLDGWRRWDGF